MSNKSYTTSQTQELLSHPGVISCTESMIFQIIIPLPEVTATFFHGSMVSFCLSVVLGSIDRIFIVFYVVYFQKLLYLPRVFSSLVRTDVLMGNRTLEMSSEMNTSISCSLGSSRMLEYAILLAPSIIVKIMTFFWYLQRNDTSTWSFLPGISFLLAASMVSIEVPSPISFQYTVYGGLIEYLF